jgi:hypothetical protein
MCTKLLVWSKSTCYYLFIMENENQEVNQTKQTSRLNQVTPLSKYLAMGLFIALPFIGGWVGYTYAPEKVVEGERVVVEESQLEIGSQLEPAQERFMYVVEQSLDANGEIMERFVNNKLGYTHDMKVDGNSLEMFEISQTVDSYRGGLDERDGTLLVNDWFKVFSISYSEMSKTRMLFSYNSCCHGQAYYYSPEDEGLYVLDHEYDTENDEYFESESVQLCDNNFSQLGEHVFANIILTDEFWFSNRYYLFTDQGYALVFESLTGELNESQIDLLSSLELMDGAQSIDVSCAGTDEAITPA